ncbi:MAG TPA: winged helix-turn-helix domain-containing protein [Nitrososphaerales archaeon]|nr:winged helix-turn-helix domain-containing protein [Nitrososphaerales archaeon]HUK74916.1 winged helix-turn-helix domain-containing protein [Nitrososphaerales archaeon]
MTSQELGEILSSKARLRIADLVSLRPRTLKELADQTGITVQAVLKHLEKLKELGVLEEKRFSSSELPARRVYAIRSFHVGDFSNEDLTIVKMSRAEPGSEPAAGEGLEELERLSEDFLVQRRRIRDEARRLGRMIDEMVSGEERIAGLIGGLRLHDDEKLILHTYFTEESAEEAQDSLREHFGMKDSRRAIDRVLHKVGGFAKKTGDGDKRR